MNCENEIYSEDNVDFLGNRALIEAYYSTACVQQLGALYAALYLPLTEGYGDGAAHGYYNIPKLYGLLDTGSMEASGILQVRSLPSLALDGRGILIGFIDTGIDYAGEIFRKPDGTTRVAAIWDQTIRGESSGKLPEGFLYGSEFTQEQLNAALKTENPYDIVPSRDENGHGSYIASIAAGNELADGSFTGAAPQADIAMVKLKPAKENLRTYYQVRSDVAAYQENDIMAGVSYLTSLAQKRYQPLVLCLALGTNSGFHRGGLPLARTLDILGTSLGVVIAVGTGNETTRGHHYEGRLSGVNDYEDVEIRVGEGENGFLLELWSQSPETYSVAIRSPEGEIIPRTYVRLGRSDVFDFVLARTKVEVSYRISVTGTGEFLAQMRFINVTPGVWTIRVYNDLFVTGNYQMWLPMESFIQKDTAFLRPSEYITLTSPSDANGVISVGTYNHRNESIYLYSGRGFTTDGRVKPDLAAPGVEVEGFVGESRGAAESMRRVVRSGSSAAAAHMAGAAALLSQWAAETNLKYISSADARAFFIRGAQRDVFRTYPNREWGFGTLDVYGVFRNIQTQFW